MSAPQLRCQDDLCVCFKDTSPAGEHHFLVVPKQHITNVNHLCPADLPQGTLTTTTLYKVPDDTPLA
jgi:diadenosine tetraphosphate (Ap4A) HIT family hydrolase